MKSIVLLILFLITTFILNVIFYYNSLYYREFLKWLKLWEKKVEIIAKKEDDKKNKLQELKNKILKEKTDNNYSWDLDETNFSPWEIEKIKTAWNITDDDLELNNIKQKLKEEKEEKQKKEELREVKLWRIYEDILNKFSSYKLEILEINTSLFDVTTEYPDEYFEYYSRNLTIYFFPTKKYEDVLDVFKVLSEELPFSINEVNNFWTESFYINLNPNISDEVVRIVINYNNIVFWIKTKKSEYENIKKILKNLKIN